MKLEPLKIDFKEIIDVIETLQAGSVFLHRFICPRCKNPQLEGFPFGCCKDCNNDCSAYPVVFKKHLRVLAGTFRKAKFSKTIVRQLLMMQENRCAYCSIDLSQIQYHIEHLFPICAGGGNEISNLAITCPECNLLAGSKTFNTFYAKQKYVLEAKRHRRATIVRVV